MEQIKIALAKGAKIYASVSGGKDGQAMTKHLDNCGYDITGLIHADLGRAEWSDSMDMCRKLAGEFMVPLHIITRSDENDMVDHWKNRMNKLQGTGKPFWSSSKNRYCTSDLKRDPIDKFFRNCGNDFIISCEGIRGQESAKRAMKKPLEIRSRITSPYYDGLTVDEAIAAYTPGYRLALTWYPIFEFTLYDVWQTYQMNAALLQIARMHYKQSKAVPAWWPFHPAYAYGNERVSCMFCIMGSLNDLQTAAVHNPKLLLEMIAMEDLSGSTFKSNWSLKQLLVT